MNREELKAKCSVCSNYQNPPFARDGYCTLLIYSDPNKTCRYQGNLEVFHRRNILTSWDEVHFRCKAFKEIIDST